ncbi:MAG: hypothetical protein JW783_07925 [Bacteroidales bacterium]|nr:hypothetical protein [Bacteroidales bacterium]MBN2749867.1 hypothetical protein [Bacteroidales bacterium]
MKRLLITITATLVAAAFGRAALAIEVTAKNRQEKVPGTSCKAVAKTEMETVVLGFSLSIDEEQNDSLQQVYYRQGIAPSQVSQSDTCEEYYPSSLPQYLIYLLPVIKKTGVNPSIYQVL